VSTNLEQALALLDARLATWARSSNTDAYNALLLKVFGASSEATTALQATLSGTGLGISLEIMPAANLSGLNAGYTNSDPTGEERIYINEGWIQTATASEIEAVLLEELGHAIDTRLNGAIDTVGDEGAIFSALLKGLTPASTALTENDERLISLNGMTVSIEAAVADTTRPTGSSISTAPAYAAPTANPFGISIVSYAPYPALIDIDSDGDLDLFIGNEDGSIIFFRNTAAVDASTPAYAAPSTNPFGITNGGAYAKPACADLDGDGDLDLFIGNYDGNTLFFRNTAAPGSSAPAYAALISNPFGITDVGGQATPALADIDGDGDLDLFVGNGQGNTLFFRNTAAPGSSAPAYAASSSNAFGISDAGYSASPVFVDLDFDGDLDLLLGNSDGNTLFFRNTAAPGSSAPAYAAPSTNAFGISNIGLFSKPALADIDGDGDLDLFIGSINGLIQVLRNTAAAPIAPVFSTTANGSYGIGRVITLTVEFSEAVLVDTAGGTPRLQLETGAIDRYAVYSGGSGSKILTFSYTVQPGDTSADLDQLSSTALELNGGSIRDAAGNNAILTLAAPGATGSLAANAQLVIETDRPNGTLRAPTPAYAAGTTNPFNITDVGARAKPVLVDIDRDGDLDLFIGNYDGNTFFFRNTAATGSSAPAYAAPSTNPFGISDVGYLSSPALADIDGDGDLDLLIGADIGTLFFRNTATPSSSVPEFALPIANPFGIINVGYNGGVGRASPIIGDIDGDGDLDLLIGNSRGDTLVFRNTAAPGTSTPAYIPPKKNMVEHHCGMFGLILNSGSAELTGQPVRH
jgi:hypothetical protein